MNDEDIRNKISEHLFAIQGLLEGKVGLIPYLAGIVAENSKEDGLSEEALIKNMRLMYKMEGDYHTYDNPRGNDEHN